MKELADLFIVIFAGLIHATLQLGISALLLLYHASLSGSVKRKTKELTMNFILGFILFTALTTASVGFLILVIFSGKMPISAMVILTMILTATAFFIWLVYYRKKSTGTELWIPRSFADFITSRAEKTSDNVESFSLGMLVACAEIPFAITLIITAANSIVSLPQGVQVLALAVYVIIAAMPLWVAQALITRGKTIVEIQKWRVENKQFLKTISGVGFIVLAIFLIAFKVMGTLAA